MSLKAEGGNKRHCLLRRLLLLSIPSVYYFFTALVAKTARFLIDWKPRGFRLDPWRVKILVRLMKNESYLVIDSYIVYRPFFLLLLAVYWS